MNGTPVDFNEILAELSAFILVLGGFIGVIYTGISTLIEKRAAAKKLEVDAAVSSKKAIDDSRSRDVELAERLNAIQERVAESLEARFVKLETELAQSNTRYNELLIESTARYAALLKRRNRERTIVLKLIEGIQEGFDARQRSPHTDNCAACLAQDKALITKLEEVRVILMEDM
jgi:hypothetical protein